MADQQSTVIFYDIASGPPVRPFAPNPWKTRYALNFTKTPYTTTWVPLPDVAKQRQNLGIPACRKYADGSDFFTLPILRDPAAEQEAGDGGTLIGDSFDIAVHLHDRQAKLGNRSPLFPSNTMALHRAFNAHVDALFTNNGVILAGYYMPLDPATADETRARMAKLAGAARWEDLEIKGEQRKAMLAAFEAALGSGLATWFTRRHEGPFLEGKVPMYADLIVGGWLQMMRNCLPEWEELRGWHGGLWGRLHEALEGWAQAT
ncbi:MAG: hypothetical protein Q9183_003355 [Haloplaca sp. 2 TL-2023]